MRKAEKQMALALIETLKQAHEEIVDSINQNMPQQAMDVLADCQECAVQLGTFIEKTEGEGLSAINRIERYCEILYKIYMELQQTGTAERGKIQTELTGQITEIEGSIQRDIKERLEIVFLPYKVSMWDSLESVWKAAEKDEQCDAYVIPIPYYDKNPDGSFRELHFEGGEYPEYVPITWYKDYDFEQRKPDVIFIHNPYDNQNYVTTVDPYFYSCQLIKYTDRLVYIPYYLSDKIDINAPGVIRHMENYVLTQGVLNADKVIVQSENIKKLFIRVLGKNFPEKEKSYWERKVRGLGSPKCDRVNTMVRDDSKLPQNWRDIIYTQSGVRKKVILYNISLSPLLQNDDMLNKIKDVLAFFKEADDIALWWRPHPLYESTLASMRQELLSQYQEMVAQYKEEGWGIFDEGVDLGWAIAETDAYYGDSSSVVHLYEEAQKPVMVQSIEVRRNRNVLSADNIPVWPSAFCVEGDDIWFTHGKINALMRYSISTKKVEVIDAVPGEGIAEVLYGGIRKWKDKLCLIPLYAKEAAIYYIKDKKFSKKKYHNIEKEAFQKVYQKDEILYCIPEKSEGKLLKFNMETEEAEYITIPEIAGSYISDTVKIGDTIIAIYAYTNQALMFDLKSETASLKTFGSKGRRYTAITNIGNRLYLFDRPADCIVKIDRGNIDQEEIIYIKKGAVRMAAISSDLLIVDDIYHHEMQIINIEGKIISNIDKKQKRKRENLCATGYDYTESTNIVSPENIFYFSKSTNCMYEFEKGKLKMEYSMELNKMEFEKLKAIVSSMEEVGTIPLIENDIYNLNVWTKALRKRNTDCNKKVFHLCGERILQDIKEDLLQNVGNG